MIPGQARRERRFVAESAQMQDKPLLFVDIDGVISLWGFDSNARPAGAFHNVDGVMHFLSSDAGIHLLALRERFELVWCSGWEEKADEHLPHALALPRGLPFLSFERNPGRANGHWKLAAIDAYAGRSARSPGSTTPTTTPATPGRSAAAGRRCSSRRPRDRADARPRRRADRLGRRRGGAVTLDRAWPRSSAGRCRAA